MLKKLIIFVLVVLLIVGGLWCALYFSGSDTFGELIDKLLNGTLRPPQKTEVSETIGVSMSPDSQLPEDMRTLLEQYFTAYYNVLVSPPDERENALSRFKKLYSHNSHSKKDDAAALEILCEGYTPLDKYTVRLRLVSLNYGDINFAELVVEETLNGGVTSHLFVLDKDRDSSNGSENKNIWSVYRTGIPES